MPRKKETAGQYSMDDYRLKQVDIRLKLMEGPSYYSQTPLTSPEGAAAVMRDVLKELDREWEHRLHRQHQSVACADPEHLKERHSLELQQHHADAQPSLRR